MEWFPGFSIAARVCMALMLCFHVTQVWHYVARYRESKDDTNACEHNRKRVWKHGLHALLFAFACAPMTALKVLLLIVLVNVGMWKLVDYLRGRWDTHVQAIADGRERIPN